MFRCALSGSLSFFLLPSHGLRFSFSPKLMCFHQQESLASFSVLIRQPDLRFPIKIVSVQKEKEGQRGIGQPTIVAVTPSDYSFSRKISRLRSVYSNRVIFFITRCWLGCWTGSAPLLKHLLYEEKVIILEILYAS